MAKWREICAGHEVWINDVDHLDPHCHIIVGRREKTVNLYTLEIRNPPPHNLPPRLRKALKTKQAELLKAWEQVKIVPQGSNTQAW